LTIEKLQDKVKQIHTSKFIHKAPIHPPRKSVKFSKERRDPNQSDDEKMNSSNLYSYTNEKFELSSLAYISPKNKIAC